MPKHTMTVDGVPVLQFHTESNAPVTYSSAGATYYAHQDDTLVAYWKDCR